MSVLFSVKSLGTNKLQSYFRKFGATDKPCGEDVRMLTKKNVAKRYMIAKKLVPLHYES